MHSCPRKVQRTERVDDPRAALRGIGAEDAWRKLNGRTELGFRHRTRRVDRDARNCAAIGRLAVAEWTVRQEVAERVQYEASVAPLAGAEHVWSVSDDERRPGREDRVGECHRVPAIDAAEEDLGFVTGPLRLDSFGAEVHRHDDRSVPADRTRDMPIHRIEVSRVRDPAVVGRVKAEHGECVANQRHHTRRQRVRAGHEDVRTAQMPGSLREARLPGITRMIVGDVADDDRFGREVAQCARRRDRLSKRITVCRRRAALPLGHRALPDRAFDVQQDHVRVGDEWAQRREQRYRVG